ncbi:DUF3089 domain-containing protein [soil metagenome]
MATNRSVHTVAALVAVLALGLVACSSDGSDGSPPSTSERTTTTAANEVAEPLARYADYASESYEDPTHWVCRPDAEDICDSNLDATVIEADGTTTVERHTVAEDPPVDCFYVYPTISRDTTPFSDWKASPDEEGFVTLQQAARLNSVCRVFAPVYRQATLTSLTSRLAGTEVDGPTADPYADVLDAFRTYMAEDNDGRGVVLVGHSQGTGMLSRLIGEEIDPNADVRRHLVGAYLAGGAVAVPDGEEVGGDFDEVPLCTEGDETGCITTWASFRSTAPPPANSFFGKPRGAADGQVAGCVNPAAVGGGDAELHAYFPADATASILDSLGAGGGSGPWLAGPTGEAIDTPFVSLPGLVTGSCADTDGYRYLSVAVHGDPADPRSDDINGDLTPEWGLHLVDVSLVMGDIVDRVRDQSEAYAG